MIAAPEDLAGVVEEVFNDLDRVIDTLDAFRYMDEAPPLGTIHLLRSTLFECARRLEGQLPHALELAREETSC